MSYEPPPPQWSSGKDAIKQIRADINQSVDQAIKQLKAAIAHRAVAVRLTGMRRPLFGSSPISVPTVFRLSPEMWADADISADGTVRFSDEPPRSFEVLRSHLFRYWPATRRGRKPKLNKQIIADKVFKLMDYHNEFVDEDKEWNCQARLEEAIAEYLNDRHISLASSTIRSYVVPALEEWRKRK